MSLANGLSASRDVDNYDQGGPLGSRPPRSSSLGQGHDDGSSSRFRVPQARSEERLTAIETSYRRLQREDPAGWQEYLAELGDLTAGEPDATAGEEWPEYNA